MAGTDQKIAGAGLSTPTLGACRSMRLAGKGLVEFRCIVALGNLVRQPPHHPSSFETGRDPIRLPLIPGRMKQSGVSPDDHRSRSISVAGIGVTLDVPAIARGMGRSVGLASARLTQHLYCTYM